MTVDIDWGDGSPITHHTPAGDASNWALPSAAMHTYAEGGYYAIEITGLLGEVDVIAVNLTPDAERSTT